MAFLRYLAQLFLSGSFIVGGTDAFRQPGMRVQQAAGFGVPKPELAVRANGAAMAIGGAALALDVAPRAAAVMLTLCLIPTTLAGHAFWKDRSEASRVNDQTQFLKNLAMLGGLLLVASSGGKRDN